MIKLINIRFMMPFLAIMILFSFCLSPVSGNEESLNIVCTNSILADFTSNLIKENVSIEYIMPAGVCPSHFDTSPSDISLITKADIIISLGWEPWLTSLIESSGNTECEQIRCADLGEWNYPSGAEKYVEKIGDELSILLPDIDDTIKTNQEEYLMILNNTFEELKLLIDNEGYQNKSVICMEWQSDFIKWLGFDIKSSYSPPESLSAQDMLNISKAAQDNEIYAIIDNLQSGTDFGARIASESGASHVIFTNFPGAIPGTDTYLDMVTYNTEQIINGISTYEYKQGEIIKLEEELSSIEMQRNISLFFVVIFGLISVTLLLLYKKK